MRQINNKETADAKLTKTKSEFHNKMVFKDAVVLQPHILLRILSHRIAPDSSLDGFNIPDRQGTTNHTLNIYLVTNHDRSVIQQPRPLIVYYVSGKQKCKKQNHYCILPYSKR